MMYINYIMNTYPDLFLTKNTGSKHNFYLFSRFTWHSKRLAAPSTKYNPLYNNFLSSEFKLNYKAKRPVLRSPQPNSTPSVVSPTPQVTSKLLRSFKSYLYLNSASQNDLTLPHFTFSQFYLGHRKGGLAVLNVRKLFDRWKDSYFLMFNLFYYELETLTFGSSFFKHELLALNWQYMQRFKFMWRYVRPFIALKPNKITTHGDFVFYRLNLLGLRIGVVVDILYHNKTVYYLHRSGFYTMGLVPVNYNINSLDFSIPYSSDSVLSQAFFIRFLTLTQQNVGSAKYNSLKNTWNSNL